MKKDSTVTFRLPYEIKQCIEENAKKEHRPIGSMIYVMLKDFANQNSEQYPDLNNLFSHS